mmetsp:Transcript_5586/g.13924  ORF Transcript_5586/g.13924 Transcript_5586/m.13924 type:complete len:295 (-) Transcript_5586:216-1100(-)
MPRPMRSVATSTHVLPDLKLSTAAARAAGDCPALRLSTRTPSYSSSRCSALARSFDATNTSTGGLSPELSSCLRASTLPCSRPTNSRRCDTVDTAVLRAPTVTRSGCTSTDRASASTRSGSVALNSACTRCGFLHASSTPSICSMNPSSNSLSASSSTRKRVDDSTSLPSLARLAQRSGLASRMSTLEKLLPAAVDLVSSDARRPVPGSSSLSARACCAASSCVGDSTTALMAAGHSAGASPLAAAARLSAHRRSTMGTRNASVLPLPVGATASRSRPASREGMACLWMGVGSA